MSSALHGDPEGSCVMKFWLLYLGPFSRKKIQSFDEIRRFLELGAKLTSGKYQVYALGYPL